MKGVKRSLADCLEGLFVDLHEMGSWLVAGFSDRTPYPTGKRSDGGAVRKVCRGCDIGIFGTFPFEGLGLQFDFSFQTPIRASEFMKRSDNLTYSSA